MADTYPEVHAAEFRILVFLEKRASGENISIRHAPELDDIKDLDGVLKELLRRDFIEKEIYNTFPVGPYRITKAGLEILAAYRR